MASEVESTSLEQLNGERRDALRFIDEIQAEQGTSEHQQRLNDLKEEYNRIASGMRDIPNTGSRDPLHVLPLEVWAQIIHFSLQATEYPRALLILTLVSHDWRQALIYTSSLWAHIHLSRHMNDLWAITALFLEFSRNMPISITATMPLDDVLDTISAIFEPHASRITEFKFLGNPQGDLATTPGDDSLWNYIPVYKLIKAFSLPNGISKLRLEKMRRLEIDPRTVEELSQIITPCIKAFENLSMTTRAIQLLSTDMPLLEEVRMEGEVKDIIHLLRGAPQLRALDIIHQGEDPTDGPKGGERAKTLPTFPYLRELSLTCTDLIREPPSLRILLTSSPVLQEIHLSVNYFFMKTIATIARVPTLKTFTIRLVEGHTHEQFYTDEYPDVIHRNYSLRTLKLVTDASYSGRSIYPIFVDRLLKMFAEQYLDVINVYFDFKVTQANFGVVFNYLYRLSNLRCLFLAMYMYDYEPPNGSLHFPHLGELIVNQGRLLWDLVTPQLIALKIPWLESSSSSREPCFTNLWTLETNAVSQYGTGRILDPLHLLNLVRIHIRVHDFDDSVNLPSFPFLTTLKLSASHLTYPQCTLLCISLLYNPDHCPRLEHLDFGAVAELDFLFLMLERRNFLVDSKISRIRKLILPVLGDHLRAPLLSLLKGLYPKRPSLLELSIEGTREALFDEDVYVVLLFKGLF